MTPRLWVDADACPVKPEVYRVAERHALEVVLVAASWMRVPDDPRIRLAQDWLDRYELEPYLLYQAVRAGYRVEEAPVTVRYHSRGTTKMRLFRDGWRILRPLVHLRLGLKS